MTQNACRDGKIWIHIFPNKPITLRPAETHMSSGVILDKLEAEGAHYLKTGLSDRWIL